MSSHRKYLMIAVEKLLGRELVRELSLFVHLATNFEKKLKISTMNSDKNTINFVKIFWISCLECQNEYIPQTSRSCLKRKRILAVKNFGCSTRWSNASNVPPFTNLFVNRSCLESVWARWSIWEAPSTSTSRQ